MVALTSGFNPVIIQGITVHPQNPLQFDFIIHPGDQDLEGAVFEDESKRLIKYFLAALTVPEDQLWVNLSPYEENRIIAQEFGNTEMGRDLLAQDYMLKQLSASLMYPEEDLGREFWSRVHKEAQSRYGTTEIPMNTFNKIWIVPEKAVVHRNGSSVFVVESKLKVLLEEDYAALEHNALNNENNTLHDDVVSGVSSEIVREILIPAIEQEVNEGATFANLRQIYHSLILATWYKKNLKDSFLGKVYVDQGKTKGIETDDKLINQKIYDQYITAFKKGVYNYIREDMDPVTKNTIPRKYFSGGVDYAQLSQDIEETGTDPVSTQFFGARNVRVNLDGVDQNGVTVDTASIIKSAGATKTLVVQNDQAMFSVMTDKVKSGLGIASALTRQSLAASVIRYHKKHSVEETNDFTRALASLAVRDERVAPIVDDSGTPAQEIKAAGIAVSAPLDVTLVWETQDYGLLKLTDVYAETGGGPVNSAKTFANQDAPFGIAAISYPDPLRKSWESSIPDQGLMKYFAEAAAGGTKVNVLNIVDGQPLRMLAGRGEAISDELVSRLLLQLDRMLTEASNLQWLMLTAGGGIAYDRTHYLYGAMVEKAHDFGVDAFIDFKYSSTEREIRSVLEVERKQPQDILAPNIREFILILEKLRMVEPSAFNRRTMTLEQIESYARALIEQYNLKGILITRDKEGIIFVPREGQVLVEPAIPVVVKSHTGAGDAASAGFVLALIQGKSYTQAIKEANIFGAATVTLPGSQVATKESIRPLKDSALLAVSFDEGVHAISRWIASRLMTKKENEPLVIAINGAPGAGKTTLKKIIVAALKQRGFEKDKDNVYTHYDSHRYIHYYEELWESMSGAESLDELWGNKFYGHNGIVIVESVVKEIPPEWRSRENLLLVQLVAGEQNRRDRLANRGSSPDMAREKAAYDGQKLDDFAHAVSVINDESIINMLFLGIQKFLYSFDQAMLNDAGEVLMKEVRQVYRLINSDTYNSRSLEQMYRAAVKIAASTEIKDIEGQRVKRLLDSGGYERGYLLFREREPGDGTIVEENKDGRLLRDGTLQPRIENDSVSHELGDWIQVDESRRVAALKNKLKEEFDDIVRELERVLAGQADRKNRLTVVLTNFMEAVRALQSMDQAKLHQEVTWEDLVQRGYSVNIYPTSIPFSPEAYTAIIFSDGVALHESKVVYQVYPGLKLIHLTMYYPRFPEKGETGFTPGSGRALLRHLFNPKQYAGYHVISSASEEARKSFARMGDFHIDRDNPEVVGVDEIVPGPQGITPLMNVGRVKDAFNNFFESLISSSAFIRLNKTQQQYLLKVLRLANVHLIVPDSAMTAEVSNDPFEQHLLLTHGVTHLDRHSLNQALLMSGVNQLVIANIKDQVWEELKGDIENGVTVNELLKKGYRAKLGIGSGKRMTTALQLLTKKSKPLALPVIPIFTQHWGKESARKAAATLMERYAPLVEERSGQFPKVIWVQEDIGTDLNALAGYASTGQMTRINETFRRIYESLKNQQQAPYLSQKILASATLADPQVAFGLSELMGIFTSLKETASSVSREDIIENLQEQSLTNEQDGRVDYDLEFNLELLKSLDIYPIEFHREIEGMKFETFVNLLWSDYIQLVETVAYLKEDGEESLKLRRWRIEVHARSNMIERDLNDFVPFIRSLAEETAKQDPNAVMVFVRGKEHERINQILFPQEPRPLTDSNLTVDLPSRWKDGVITSITDDDMDMEFVTSIIENVGSLVGLDWEEISQRGLKGQGIEAAVGRDLRRYINQVYKDLGYPNGLMIAFSWLLNQRDEEQQYLLPSVWDDFIEQHLVDLRIAQYRETATKFYKTVAEQFRSEEFRMAIVQYFISLYTSGMEEQQRQRFVELALRGVMPGKDQKSMQNAFPALFDQRLTQYIGDFAEWMRHFNQAGYVKPVLDMTAKDISIMSQWFEVITAGQPFLLPVAPRPDSAMTAEVPEELVVKQQKLRLVSMTPELLREHKRAIAELVGLMVKGSPVWMLERDLEDQAIGRIQYDPALSFVVLDENGLPVGMTIAYQPHLKKYVYLSSFSVHPDFHGTPVSSWLLYKTFKAAITKDLKIARWETYPKVTTGEYERANGYYRRIGAYPISVAQDGVVRHMEYVQDLTALLPRIYGHFKQKELDYAMLSNTVFHQTDNEAVIKNILLQSELGRPVIKVEDGVIYELTLGENELINQSALTAEDFKEVHRRNPHPVVIAGSEADIDLYLDKRIPEEVTVRINYEGTFVNGIRQEAFQTGTHDLVHMGFALSREDTEENHSYVLDVVAFQALLDARISPAAQMMDRAYEELVVRKLENYYINLAQGKTEAVEKLDRELDRILTTAGWVQDDFNRLIQIVDRLRGELDEKGYAEIKHRIRHQLTRADLSVNQYDHQGELLEDAAVLAELPQGITIQDRKFKAVHITPALLSEHLDEFAVLMNVMNPKKTLVQMQERIAHLIHTSDEYAPLYSIAIMDQEGKPVGMSLGNRSDHGDYLYLSTFVVDPKLQGSPLASWLLYHTFYSAHADGLHTAKWETFPADNSEIYRRANSFYAKVGAIPIADTPYSGFRRVEYVYNLAKGLPKILDEFDRKLADSAMLSASASRADREVKSAARKTWDILLEIVSAMRHSSEENIVAVMNKYRGMAVFYKELGNNGVYFLEELVNDPAEFGGRFKKGDKILKFHVDGTDKTKMRILLKEVLSAAVTSQLREAGYAGIYFNTTNQSRRQQWLRETKSVVMNAPRGTAVKTYLTALYGRVFYGYSISGSPKRVVYAFHDLPVKTTVTEVTAALPTGEELRPIREMLHVSYPHRIDPLLDWLKQQNYLPLAALDESAVIDAGSSYGYSTVDIGNLLLTLNPRLHVYGVDPAQELDRQRQKLSIPANVVFIQDDHRLQKGHRPANIKLIISTNMLVYYDESTKKKVIKQMSEYLEEGGLMVLGTGGHAERNNSLNFIVLRKLKGQMFPVELVFNLSFYSPDNNEEVFGYWRKYFPDEIGEAFKVWAADMDQLLKEERNRIRQQLYKLGQTAWERQLPEIFKAQRSLLRTEGINVVNLPDGSVSVPLEGILSAAGAGVDKAMLADRYWDLRQRDESLYKTQLERIQSVSTGFLVEGRYLFEALTYFAQLGEAGLASEKDGPPQDLNSLIGSLKKLSLQIRVEIDYHRNTGYSASHLDFIRTWQALNDFIDVYENNEALKTNLDRLYRQYVNNDGVLTVDQAMVGNETQAKLWEGLPLPEKPQRLTKAVRAEIRVDGKLLFNGLLSPDAGTATPVHDGSSHMAIAQVRGSYSYVLEWLAVRAMLKSDEYDPSSTKLIRVIEERVTELMEDYIQIYDSEGPEAAEAFYESSQGENIITEFGWKKPQFTEAVRISREARKKWRNDGAGSQEPVILEFDLRPETLLRQDQSMMARKPRILVVDDYESIRKATSNLLRSMDYEVLTAVNGVDALKVIGEELQAGRPVDLILTDRSMPEMNGEQLIINLRQDDRFSSVPVIMNTSAEESEILKLSEKLRVPVFSKPFDMDTLLDLIKANLPDQAMAANVPAKESVIEVFMAIERIFLAAVSGEFNEARMVEARKALAELEKSYQNPYLVHLIQDQSNYLGVNVLSGLLSADQVAGSVRSAIERNKKIVSGLKQLTSSRELARHTKSFSLFDFDELANRNDAADEAMLSFIQDDKTKQLLRWMQRASFRIYHSGPMDAKELMTAAEAVNPGFRHPFNESQLTQFKGEQFERMIRLVNEQIMIPRGFIIHGFKSDGSVSYLTIEPGSWKEEPYLGRLSIWTASVKAAEEHISDAFSLGWFAFLDHQTRETFYRGLYQRLRQGVQTNDPGGVTALYGKLFKNLKLSEQDFVRIMLNNVLLEEKIHARDAAYTAGLKGDYRTLWVDAPEILIAQTITRPEFELLQRGEGDPDRLNWLAVMEFSAKLQGVILEMEDYLQKGREDLAYFLFFDYLRNQMDYLTSHNEHNHNVAFYFIDELLERHLVRDDRLLGYLNRDPDVPPVRQALALLHEIYNKHFYSEEERLQKLTEKDRDQIRLLGPLADQSILGEDEPLIIFDQGRTADNNGVDNAMLDELLQKPGELESIVVVAVGAGIYGAYKIWRRYTVSGNIFNYKRSGEDQSYAYIVQSKSAQAKRYLLRMLKEDVNRYRSIESLLEMGVSEVEIGKVILESLRKESEKYNKYTNPKTEEFLLKWGSRELIPFFHQRIISEGSQGNERKDIITFLTAHNAWESVRVEYEHQLTEYRYDKEVMELILQKFADQERELKKINLPSSLYGPNDGPREGVSLIQDSMLTKVKEYIKKHGDFTVIYHPAEYDGNETINVSSAHTDWATTYADIPKMTKDAYLEILPPVDNAQLSEVGGIDLNPNNFEIETRGENPPAQFEFDAQKLQNLNIQGFVPVIINITPITNIPFLLGIADEGPSGQKQVTTTDESAPLDRRERFSLRETGELSRL